MAKKAPKDAGQEFLDKLLAHLPEDKRAGARETLAGSEALLTALGEGTLAQSEFSRHMDEARAAKQAAEQEQAQALALRTSNAGWYATNAAALAHHRRLIDEGLVDPTTGQLTASGQAAVAAGGSPDDAAGDPQPRVDLSGYVRADQLPQLLQQTVGSVAQNLASYATALPFLMHKHAQEFRGEILDPQALNEFCTKRGLDLTTGYDQFVASKRHEVAEAKHAEALKAAVEEATRKTRETLLAEMQRGSLPYPVPGSAPGAGEVGVLDAPRPSNGAADPFTPAAAAAAYLAAIQGATTGAS